MAPDARTEPTFHAGGHLGIDHGHGPARFTCDVRLFRDQLARIPDLTEAQARRVAAAFRRALERAQEVATSRARAVEAEEEWCPVAALEGMGLGVVGLLARDKS